jgi:serine/threonine-protein kinase
MNDSVDTSQWQRLGTLFDEAIGLGAGEQAELLQATEREDAELARALRSLLQADARHHAHTSEHRERVMQGSFAAIDALGVGVGDRVGPYVLRENLGQGGMGVVFRAERADGQVAQQVALKIVRRALLDASGRERFLREREIVAAFQHPYIARMLDVGQTADGSPYLAMELIRGLPITDWCDANKLDARARVEVFLRVCEAVQHAHANLVLHRDLKPNNVLVGADGLPKLIDFGIAKPLAMLAGEEHQQTATAHRFFSPSNVAPEQLRGERVGVACDVYQLGTVLHELLCGATVFDASGLTAGQFEEKILDVAPEAPSARAERASVANAQTHGMTTPTALARELRGDLDAIVAHALRKSPSDRYGSVEQLADDLRRYLQGLPVAAQRGRRWYRARKFLRRHALAVGASAAAVVLVAAFVAALWVQSLRIARERDLARQERDHAEHVAQFLTDVFKAADPAEALSRDQPIGTVLDNARKRLQGHLGDEPGQRVRMLGVMAGVYTSLDDRDTAVALLDQAQQVIAHTHAFDPRIVLAYDLQRARLMKDRGDHKAQRDYAHRALALQVALGDSPGKQWDARVLLADSYNDQGENAAGEAMQALLRELAHDPDVAPVDYAREQVQTGQEWAIANATAKAEPLLRQGLRTLEAQLPADHPDVLNARKSLADLLIFNLDRPDQAATILQDVIARQQRIYGERSSSAADSMITLGHAYLQMHRLDDGVAVTQSACDILHQVHTRPHQDWMGCASSLGNMYEGMDGKLELAAVNFTEAARVAAVIDGENSSDAMKLRAEVGHIRMLQGRLDEAEQLLSPIYHAADLQSADFAGKVIFYADVLHRLHRNAEAAAVLDRIEPVLKKHPDQLEDETVAATKLRRAIVAER